MEPPEPLTSPLLVNGKAALTVRLPPPKLPAPAVNDYVAPLPPAAVGPIAKEFIVRLPPVLTDTLLLLPRAEMLICCAALPRVRLAPAPLVVTDTLPPSPVPVAFTLKFNE